MRTTTALFVGLLCSGIAAQTGSTITDFGAGASRSTTNSTQTAGQSVPKGTKFGYTKTNPPASVRASVSGAYATSYASAAGTWMYAREYGSVYSSLAGVTLAAGTTTTKTGAIGTAHTTQANLVAKSGTKGQVEINWYNVSTTAAKVSFVVNVNGKNVATLSPTSPNGKTRVDATAGATGVVVQVTATCSVGLAAKGSERYSSWVTCYFKAGQSSSQCKLAAFGKACNLNVSTSTYAYTRTYGKTTISYDVIEGSLTGADRTETALVALGPKLTTPVALPGGCNLFINPVVILPLGAARSFRFSFRAPDAVSLHAQAASFGISGKGLTVKATGGVTISCPKRVTGYLR